MTLKMREFSSRDPATYKSPSCVDRYWPEVPYTFREEHKISEYFVKKSLHSNLGRKIGIEFMIFQMFVWAAIGSIKYAAVGRPARKETFFQEAQMSIYCLLAFGVVWLSSKCLAKYHWYWKFVIRGAGLAYSIAFALLGSIDDLAYLISPFLLCITMYVLNWKKVTTPTCWTYLIGVLFLVITSIIYIALRIQVTFYSGFLMGYIYNCWIAIHLDTTLQKLFSTKATGNQCCCCTRGRYLPDMSDPGTFMTSYLGVTSVVFHIATQAIVMAMMVIFILLIYLVLARLVCYKPAREGETQAEAQTRHVENAAMDGAFAAAMGLLILVGVVIAICVLLPFPWIPCLKIDPGNPPAWDEETVRVSVGRLRTLRLGTLFIDALINPEENNK